MQEEITLQIDKDLLERAKAFSEKTGKSISEVVSDLLERLPKDLTGPRSLTPVVSSLRGILRGSGLSEEDYRRHLEAKHL